jgi:hypothetical protein
MTEDLKEIKGFFFFAVLSLNSGTHVGEAGAVPLEPHLQL